MGVVQVLSLFDRFAEKGNQAEAGKARRLTSSRAKP
jgi:hypothetical protein